MGFLSISTLAFGLILTYITYSVWSIAQIFIIPPCSTKQNCLVSFLKNQPSLNLYLFTSPFNYIPRVDTEVTNIGAFKDVSYLEPWKKELTIDIPKSTLNNGSLYCVVVLVPEKGLNSRVRYTELLKNPHFMYTRFLLTQYNVPDQYVFNLLHAKNQSDTTKKSISVRPVTHIKSQITVNLLTDPLEIRMDNMPGEIAQILRFGKDKIFYPALYYNFLETRIEHLKELDSSPQTLTFSFEPISLGKLRFALHIEATMKTMKSLGFSMKDLDDVKNIFAGTNLYLLCGTIVIVSVHLLFDFLAFKNDISFWRSRSNMIGLSTRTVIWRAFSQTVIFFYLLDEKASLIVLIPSGIGLLIELWKVQKVVRRNKTEAEKDTEAYDAESMRYLSYILYPLCVIGAIYSLVYQPHKSWYSWTINSMVKGVYAFGFLFMLPQLFVNYRLKSVAALPWRAFTYKAFNTFIDDIFAFLIVMPTAHRVACFRDDVVFLIYLYQRWLYPVDTTRLDESAVALGEGKTPAEKKQD